MVGRWEGKAQRFKELEEAKWGQKEAKSAKQRGEMEQRDPHAPVLVTGPEKDARVVALLEKLKVTESASVLRSDFAEELFELAQNDAAEGETHTRVGAVGLSAAYYAEDFGAFTHKKQLFDGVFNGEEDEASKMQTRAKIRGMLVEHKLVPGLHSALWQTSDPQRWEKWARDRVDEAAAAPSRWTNLNLADAADVISGIVTEDWAPGAKSAAESEEEWARRAQVTKEVQKTRRVNTDLYPIEWVSRTYIEPNWTEDDAKRRWRERKVVLQIDLRPFQLPEIVFARLKETLGPRLRDGHVARIVADRYGTKEENRLYSLLLMRSLLTDAWEAHPRFVRVNESRQSLKKELDAALRERVAKEAANPLPKVISVRFH